MFEAKSISKSFKGAQVQALRDVSLTLKKGSVLGILGESGSGKSTLAKILLRILDADKGEVYFEGKNITTLNERALKTFRSKVQPVFQDPFVSLDPRLRVRDVLNEPLEIRGLTSKSEREKKIVEAMSAVRMDARYLERFPRQLSGGESQRIAIARALIPGPEVLICDEPVSSLDAFTRREILDLLLKLKREKAVSYIFISHDLRVIERVSDEVLVLKDGQVCEQGPTKEVFSHPKHAYTKALVGLFSSQIRLHS